MDPAMNEELAAVMEGLANAETGNDPAYQRRFRRPDGSLDRRVGRFGILESKFDELAMAAGMPGASWRNEQAMDHVVRKRLHRDLTRYGDSGDARRLAMVSFRFGHAAASRIAESGTSLDADELRPVKAYVEAAESLQPYRPVGEGAVRNPTHTDNRGRAEESIRAMMRTMRNVQRSRQSEMAETVEQEPPVITGSDEQEMM